LGSVFPELQHGSEFIQEACHSVNPLKIIAMNFEGWITLQRKLVSSNLWLSEPFTRGQAWVDMLALANHKDGFILVRGINVTIKRGQIGWSEVRLAERWKWSRSKIRRFLNTLEKEQQIEQQKNNVSLILSIVNYDLYQKKDSKTDIKKTAERQQKDTNNECIINEDNENNKINVVFESFRREFPGTKGGFKTEFDNFLKKNDPETVHLLLPALKKEKQYRSTAQFVPAWKNLSTWINKKCWELEFTEENQAIVTNQPNTETHTVAEFDFDSLTTQRLAAIHSKNQATA